GQTAPVQLDTLASLNGQEFCRTITLTNYGAYPQTVQGLDFGSAPPGLRTTGSFPMEIAPGESLSVTICYQHAGDTAFQVTVNVNNGCELRSVALLPLISGVDSTVPLIQQQYGPCDTDRTFSILESGALNSGVASITVVDTANVAFSYDPTLPARQVQLRMARRDPYQDMYYRIVVTDAVGNSTTISDLVGGFTLSVQNALSQQVGLRVDRPWLFGNLSYGDERCDTFYLRNYGLLPLVLERPRVIGNVSFSIPPEQLPIILQKGEIRPLVICVTPRATGDISDTLAIDFKCGSPVELVEMRATVDPLNGQARDRCGNVITFQVDGFTRQNFLQAPVPNPASAGAVRIVMGLDGPQRVSLVLYDNFGNEALMMLNNDEMPGGIAQLDASVESLPQGVYHLQMRTSNGTTLSQKLLIAR
ncbi:MAG TPA: hypothetical protein VHI13_21240, partial [Candidatus Kapabacteria bacterium]|nr:hypothetical protein [Candidatus Kapabacteria bacterium]